MRRRVRQHRRQAPERGFRGAKAARSANAWAPLHGAASLQRPSAKPKDVTKELCGSQPRALDSGISGPQRGKEPFMVEITRTTIVERTRSRSGSEAADSANDTMIFSH